MTYEKQGCAYDPYAVGHEKVGRDGPPMTYAEIVSKTSRTIKAHVDKDGNVALVTAGLSPDEIKSACDRIKALVS